MPGLPAFCRSSLVWTFGGSVFLNLPKAGPDGFVVIGSGAIQIRMIMSHFGYPWAYFHSQ